jgi:hypothetical protein
MITKYWPTGRNGSLRAGSEVGGRGSARHRKGRRSAPGRTSPPKAPGALLRPPAGHSGPESRGPGIRCVTTETIRPAKGSCCRVRRPPAGRSGITKDTACRKRTAGREGRQGVRPVRPYALTAPVRLPVRQRTSRRRSSHTTRPTNPQRYAVITSVACPVPVSSATPGVPGEAPREEAGDPAFEPGRPYRAASTHPSRGRGDGDDEVLDDQHPHQAQPEGQRQSAQRESEERAERGPHHGDQPARSDPDEQVGDGRPVGGFALRDR